MLWRDRISGRRPLLGALALLLAFAVAGCGGGGSASNGASPTAPTSGGLAGNYPAPQDQTFQGCPPQGDGGDGQLNVRKNRIDTGAWQPTSVSSIVTLPYPQDVAKVQRANWSSSDAAAVGQYEGRPVQVDGYILLVRHEGTESVNCHDPNERDFHMWVAASPGGFNDRANSFIAEVTPRSRALNSGWQPDNRLLGLTGQHVRISGWLMLDEEHPEQVGKTRATLWEVHPILSIDVDQNGAWTSLNGQSLVLSGGSSNSGGSGYSPATTRRHTTRHRARRHSSSG